MKILSLFFSLSRRTLLIIGTALLVLWIWWRFGRGNGKDKVEKMPVEIMDLSQEVSVSGQVKASQAVDLGFEKSGKVAQVLAEVGDRVEEGQELVVLENADLRAQVLQAEASVQSAQAQYQGQTAEVQSSVAEVASAQAGGLSEACC